MHMDERDRATRTDLFTLRVWREAIGPDQTEWRGKLQHVLTGEARYFRGWDMLTRQLTIMLESPQLTIAERRS